MISDRIKNKLRSLERRIRPARGRVIAVRDAFHPDEYTVAGEKMSAAEFKARFPKGGEGDDVFIFSVVYDTPEGKEPDEPWWLNV